MLSSELLIVPQSLCYANLQQALPIYLYRDEWYGSNSQPMCVFPTMLKHFPKVVFERKMYLQSKHHFLPWQQTEFILVSDVFQLLFLSTGIS